MGLQVLQNLIPPIREKALPNGLRLSCGATLYGSQTQFYPGGRQLQAHVRQLATDAVGATEPIGT